MALDLVAGGAEHGGRHRVDFTNGMGGRIDHQDAVLDALQKLARAVAAAQRVLEVATSSAGS